MWQPPLCVDDSSSDNNKEAPPITAINRSRSLMPATSWQHANSAASALACMSRNEAVAGGGNDAFLPPLPPPAAPAMLAPTTLAALDAGNLLHAAALPTPLNTLPIHLLTDIFLRLSRCSNDAAALNFHAPPATVTPSAAFAADICVTLQHLPQQQYVAMLTTPYSASGTTSRGAPSLSPSQRSQSCNVANVCRKAAPVQTKPSSLKRNAHATKCQRQADEQQQVPTSEQQLKAARDAADSLPPPKKKWIRHYLNGYLLVGFLLIIRCSILPSGRVKLKEIHNCKVQ